jgi:hypothetical protein
VWMDHSRRRGSRCSLAGSILRLVVVVSGGGDDDC